MTTLPAILLVGFFPHKTTSTFNCSPHDWIFVANFCCSFCIWSPILFPLVSLLLVFSLFTSSTGVQVFNLFFLLPVSYIARTFLLHSQSSLWLVVTVLPAECFFLHFKGSSYCCSLSITLFTNSDSWIVISMFSAASACIHFYLCSESPSSSQKHKEQIVCRAGVISYDDWQFLEVFCQGPTFWLSYVAWRRFLIWFKNSVNDL